MKSKYQTINYSVIVLILTVFSIFTSKHKLESLVYGLVILICVLILWIFLYIKRKINIKLMLTYWYGISIGIFVIGFIQMIFFNHMPTKWVDFSEYNNISFRMYSVLGNPNLLGYYISLLLIVLITVKIYAEYKINKILETVVLILSVVCLFFTFSRSSWIGLCSTLIVAGIFINKKYFKYFLLIALTIFALDIVIGTDRSSIDNIYMDSSAKYRIEAWKACIKIFKDNWLTGIGINSFGSEIVNYSAVVKNSVGHCHNIYLQVLVEMGIIGFAVISTMLVKFLYGIIKDVKIEKTSSSIVVFLITVFILIHGLFDSTVFVPPIVFLVTIILLTLDK